MSLAVKAGYVNPLTRMGTKKNGMVFPGLESKKTKGNELQDLQMKKQTVQNQKLLLETTSGDVPLPEEAKEVLDQQLEEIRSQLAMAKTEAIRSEVVEAVGAKAHAGQRPRFDSYEESSKEELSYGLYQIERDEQDGYRVKYEPYQN